jgi:cytochrome oxidase Cu insertion factor (SCO1/SenC/PrrC family)
MKSEEKTGLPKIRIIISLILVIIAVGIWKLYLEEPKIPTASENSQALIGGEFTLKNHLNQSVSDEDFKGKYALMYFGYTYCPDVCPMDLQILTEAFNALPNGKKNQVTPIFITIDPERDTVEVMAEYIKFFDKKLIGLTGTVEEINGIKKAYRVYAAKADDTADYLVDHTAFTYFMGKDGKLLQHFSHGTAPEEMATKILPLIK